MSRNQMNLGLGGPWLQPHLTICQYKICLASPNSCHTFDISMETNAPHEKITIRGSESKDMVITRTGILMEMGETLPTVITTSISGDHLTSSDMEGIVDWQGCDVNDGIEIGPTSINNTVGEVSTKLARKNGTWKRVGRGDLKNSEIDKKEMKVGKRGAGKSGNSEVSLKEVVVNLVELHVENNHGGYVEDFRDESGATYGIDKKQDTVIVEVDTSMNLVVGLVYQSSIEINSEIVISTSRSLPACQKQ
ncbi:hypothetical protein QYF36_000720 [Acer negundo]|nr:hypothetical protein QYF36_000720 [Acer negundo]